MKCYYLNQRQYDKKSIPLKKRYSEYSSYHRQNYIFHFASAQIL